MKRLLIASLIVAGCAGTGANATTTSSTATTGPPSTATSTSTTTTTTSSTTTTSVPEPTFSGAILDATGERLAHSWTEDCPASVDDLVMVEITHRGFDGGTHEGVIVVARDEGENVLDIFRVLFEIGYPIESVIPIGDLPVGIEDDDPDYNNTSGLHCRRATGSSRWSEHAKGIAIDINPFQNPFTTPNILWPANSVEYLDRGLGDPAMIIADDEVVRTFADHGWRWGGYWDSIKDYQHFSTTGR